MSLKFCLQSRFLKRNSFQCNWSSFYYERCRGLLLRKIVTIEQPEERKVYIWNKSKQWWYLQKQFCFQEQGSLLDGYRKAPAAFVTPAKNVFSPLYNRRSLPSALLCIILADSLAYKIPSWENYYWRNIISVVAIYNFKTYLELLHSW